MINNSLSQLLYETKERCKEFKDNSDSYNKEAIINDYIYSINRIIDYCEKRGRY